MGRNSRLRKERKQQAAQAKKVAAEKKSRPALTVSPGFWRKNLVPAVLLLLLPFLLYYNTSSFEFVLDDVIVLAENDFVREGMAGIGDILSNDAFTGYLGEHNDLLSGGRYRPLSMVIFAVEYEWFGDNPGPYHMLNVVWYAILGLIIFRVMGILFPGDQVKWYLAVPFVTALLFLFHPVHSEAVANIKGRDEIITLVFSLATLYCSLRYLVANKLVYLLLSALSFLLALLAKENALTFLAVIPLTIFMFTDANRKQLLLTTAPLLVAIFVYFIIRHQVLGFVLDSGVQVTGLMNDPFRDMSGSEKYATIAYTLWEYIRLMVFPHPLTHDYYPYHIPITNWTQPRAILPLLLYLVLVGYALLNFRKPRQVFAYSILYWVITLSITSNIVLGVGTFMNERFAFMPSLGYCLALAYFLAKWLPEKYQHLKWVQPVCLAVLGLVIIGYGLKTITRIPAWKDPISLNKAGVQVSRNSARVNNFMGFDYYNLANSTDDRQEKMEYLILAQPYMDKALAIHPTYTEALKGKAGVVAGKYNIDGNIDRLLNEFYAILRVRHVPYIDTYMEYLNRRGYNSKIVDFYHDVGYGIYTRSKNYELAKKYLGYGYEMAPNDTRILYDLAILNYELRDYGVAAGYAQRALDIDPNLDEVRRYLQLIYQAAQN